MTANTPGYNTRLTVYFETDRNGQPRAYYYSRKAQRVIRISVDKARAFVAAGQADLQGYVR